MTAPLCIVLKGFPRLSETFITRELEALQDLGVKFTLASLRQPTSDASKVAHRVDAPVNYLPEYLHHDPLRVMRAFASVRRKTGFSTAWQMFRADLARDMSRNRLRRFGQACVLAADMTASIRHLHAHFIHTPASVARYAAAICGISYSVSSHAKDIWTTPDWDLTAKLAESQFVCVCNEAGAQRLASLAPPERVKVWPHLVSATPGAARRARSPNVPIRLLTVARAVPKKGLHTLLEALTQLPPEPRWAWTHIGGGPMLKRLKELVQQHPYRDRIDLLGSQPHARVIEALIEHDVFVLSAVEASDGDRDGRPNALIEAMSAGLACVASPVGGIPELLRDGVGLMPRHDAASFARELAELLMTPEKIAKLADKARLRAARLAVDGETSMKNLATALQKASGQ